MSTLNACTSLVVEITPDPNGLSGAYQRRDDGSSMSFNHDASGSIVCNLDGLSRTFGNSQKNKRKIVGFRPQKGFSSFFDSFGD